MSPTRNIAQLILIFIGLVAFLVALPAQSQSSNRKSGDYYTSDLLDFSLVIGPVEDAREPASDSIVNRMVDLNTEDIQREFAEGIAEIHRSAAISRVAGSGGLDRAMAAARERQADLLIIPRLDKLVIDQVGKNGLDPVAKVFDVALFPITLIEAAIYRGERAGLGSQYLPMYDMMVTMKMKLDFYRVADGQRLAGLVFDRALDAKVNKDNLEGARFESMDDWIKVGQEKGLFLVREFGRQVAKEQIVEFNQQIGRYR